MKILNRTEDTIYLTTHNLAKKGTHPNGFPLRPGRSIKLTGDLTELDLFIIKETSNENYR